jgi:hypothetical protein
MAKYGMTMAALGFAHELSDLGVSSTRALARHAHRHRRHREPAGGERMMAVSRKPDIVADAAYEVLTTRGQELNGRTLIDEELLRERGWATSPLLDDRPRRRPGAGHLPRLSGTARPWRAGTPTGRRHT